MLTLSRKPPQPQAHCQDGGLLPLIFLYHAPSACKKSSRDWANPNCKVYQVGVSSWELGAAAVSWSTFSSINWQETAVIWVVFQLSGERKSVQNHNLLSYSSDSSLSHADAMCASHSGMQLQQRPLLVSLLRAGQCHANLLTIPNPNRIDVTCYAQANARWIRFYLREIDLDFFTVLVLGFASVLLHSSCACWPQRPSDTAISTNSYHYPKLCTGSLHEGTGTVARFVQDLNLNSADQMMCVNSLSRNKELLSKKRSCIYGCTNKL